MSRAVALNCPQCGGAVGPPVGSRRTVCSFCSKPLYYAGADFLPRFVLPARLGDGEIQDRCRVLFKNPMVPSHLAGRATLLRKRRSYLPFYLLTGKRGGVLKVGKERTVPRQSVFTMNVDVQALGSPGGLSPRSLGGRPDVVVEEDTRVVLGDYRFVYGASTLAGWDLLDTDLRETVTSHLDDATPVQLGDLLRDGDVVDADIPLERVVTRGVAPGDTAAGELKVLEQQTSLVYVPVTTLTFRFGKQIFSVCLEEVSGGWVTGTLPFRRDWALMLGLPLVGLLGFLVGNSAAGFFKISMAEWMRNPGFFRIFLVVAALGAGVVVMGLQAAWVLLRTPFVVRVHAGGVRVEGAAAAPASPIQPLDAAYRALFRWLFEGARRGGVSP